MAAAKGDYDAFYEQEIAYRELLSYPPMSNLMVIFLMSKNEASCEYSAIDIVKSLKNHFTDNQLSVIGPSIGSISKINDVFRRVVYLKHLEYNVLVNVKDYIETYIEENNKFKGVIIQFDFNPMNAY